MAAEINFSRILQQLPEFRRVLSENRRMIVFPAAVIVGYYMLHDPIKDASDKLFAYIYYKYFLKDINLALRNYRENMKVELSSQKAKDPHAHNDDTLRILEIGMGPGANLDFYPKSSRVIGVEPNPYFLNELLKLQSSHPILVKVVRGYAEDLRDIPDESVDAVVSTLVLCTVNNLDRSIKEVKRVLVRGGRFYFFEHEACQSSWMRYVLQMGLSPLWQIIFKGCHLCRQIHRQIAANGFEMDHATQGNSHMMYVVQSKTEGYAVK